MYLNPANRKLPSNDTVRRRLILTRDNSAYDEVQVEVGALLLGPALPQVQEEDSLAAIQVESEDAVDAHQRLVHETGDSCLFEVLLE